MNKKVSLYVMATLVAVFISSALMAQPPSSGTTGPPCWPPPCIPIDGGTSLLIIAGLIYGGKKAFDYSKKG